MTASEREIATVVEDEMRSTSAADNWNRELITCFVIQFLIRIRSGRFDVLLLNGLYTFLAVAIGTDIVLFRSTPLFLARDRSGGRYLLVSHPRRVLSRPGEIRAPLSFQFVPRYCLIILVG